mmetsp:Transcript_25279/g.59170  ORF Transcript_25279/g.59170 Transcript_25279/m.59170 type:complete len:135 (-) Transcript_25279:36-440(-)
MESEAGEPVDFSNSGRKTENRNSPKPGPSVRSPRLTDKPGTSARSPRLTNKPGASARSPRLTNPVQYSKVNRIVFGVWKEKVSRKGAKRGCDDIQMKSTFLSNERRVNTKYSPDIDAPRVTKLRNVFKSAIPKS